MDLRPVDTESVINIRNRIRLSVVFSILAMLFYLSINSSLSGAHVSWVHMIHIIIQPILFASTVVDSSSVFNMMMYISIIAFVIDAGILGLNFISISRCFNEATASCFDRMYEKGILLIIAFIFCVTDLLTATQLMNLNTHMIEKDLHEEAEKEKLTTSREPPTWNSLLVNMAKVRSLNIFMLLFNVVVYGSTIGMVSEIPILWLNIGALAVDPICLLFDGGYDSSYYIMIRILYFVVLMVHGVTMFIVPVANSTMDQLRLIISIMFIIVDIIQIFFISEIISVLGKYNAYKREL
jgi:hypothetical protein